MAVMHSERPLCITSFSFWLLPCNAGETYVSLGDIGQGEGESHELYDAVTPLVRKDGSRCGGHDGHGGKPWGRGGWQRLTKQQKWGRQRGFARVAAAAEKWSVVFGSLLSMVAR